MKTEVVVLGRELNVAARRRRRWLVVAVYGGFSVLVALWCAARMEWVGSALLGVVFMLVANILGGRTYAYGLVPPDESGDERERNRRDHAYYVTFKWWDFSLIPALLSVALKNNAYYRGWEPAVRVFVERLPYGLLIGAGILYYTLPQAILLWTEPDMEEADED